MGPPYGPRGSLYPWLPSAFWHIVISHCRHREEVWLCKRTTIDILENSSGGNARGLTMGPPEAHSSIDFVLVTTMKQFYRMKYSIGTLSDNNNKA